MPGNQVDRVARYVQAAEALEVLQGRVRENTGEVGNLLFDRWTADDLRELACLARDARDAKREGFMRGEEVQPTGRITARIACYQHAVDWDEIDPRLERRLSAVEKRYLAERIGQNRVAAGKPRDSHNPGQIYCEESFGEDEASASARFQTEEDRMKRGKGPQMDSDPRSRPGYNPFPSTYPEGEPAGGEG